MGWVARLLLELVFAGIDVVLGGKAKPFTLVKGTAKPGSSVPAKG